MKLPNGYGSVSKLGGKRRKPFIVRKTLGYHINEETGKVAPDSITIGYTKTRAEGYQLLAEYNSSPYDLAASKMTFAQVYEEWSSKKFPTISQSGINGYIASYKSCEKLYDRVFKDLKLADLQMVIDECDKNYPTLKKIKVLFNQLYKFAIKNDICNKDYSSFVDIAQYKDRNPNKYDREKFTKDEIAKIWEMKDDKYYQIILMLLYNGLRISEFLSLKKENVHLDEQYFDVIDSKT
ncbi:MAG: site-specific integrase, partial [Agathobacter sp.]